MNLNPYGDHGKSFGFVDTDINLQENVKIIGVVDLEDKAVKFQATHSAVYANGKLYCSVFNDRETAVQVMRVTLGSIYGDKFKSADN